MKRTLLFLTAASLLAAACTRENINPAAEGLLPGQRLVTLHATAESTGTKVSYADDKTFGWEAEDSIAVWTGSRFSTAYYQGDDGSAKGPFNLILDAGAEYSDAAVYPALAAGSVSGGKLTLNLRSSYPLKTPSSVLMPLVSAISADGKTDLSFKHVGGAVKVTFKNLPKGEKTFRLLSDKGISGSFQVDLSKLGTEAVTAVPSNGTNDHVDLVVNDSDATELTLYFPVPTGELRLGVEVIADGVKRFSKAVGTKVNSISRGVILRMPDIELPATGTVLLNGTTAYPTIQAAIDAARDGDVVTASEGTFNEHVTIDEKAVTLEGAGEKTIISSVEIYKAAATVKNLSIQVSSEEHIAGHNPLYTYTYGIYLHRAGYGAVIDNVTVNMENAKSDATGLFMVNDASERGEVRDVVKNCNFNGVSGKRNAQLYAPKAELLDNTFKAGHASYGIRVGNGGKDSGDNYIGGEIKLDGNTFKEAGSADASAIQFYMLANTRVELGENTQDGSFKYLCAANNEWIFTNGNTFDPEYMYNSGTLELIPKKDEPVQGSLLTRVWGKYNATSDWDDAISTRNEWNRNAVITADKIYVAVAGNSDGQYGIAVFNRESGRYLNTITDGIEKVGTFWTCGITRLGDKIFVCNLAKDGQELIVYELDTEANTAKRVFGYTTISGQRFGDVMTSAGSMANGLLGFVNYSSGGYSEFRVENSIWNTTPVTAQYMQWKASGSQMGGVYILGSDLNNRQAVYASNKEVNFRDCWTFSTQPMDGWYISKNDYAFSTNGITESNMADPRQFWYTDDNKYMVYVSVKGTPGSPAAGYLRIVKMTGETHLDQWLNLPNETVSETYPIGSVDDDSVTGKVNTNHTGYCDIYNDGEGGLYILAGITECGMSLFKMN